MIDIPTYSEIVVFVEEQMKTNQWFQTVGFFGVLGFLANYLKKVPVFIWSRVRRLVVFTVTIEQTQESYLYFEKWLNKNYPNSYRNVEAVIEEEEVENTTKRETFSNGNSVGYVVTNSIKEKMDYRQLSDVFWIRRGIVYIQIFKGREKLENASNLSNAFMNRYKISGLFAKRTIKKILTEVMEQENLRKNEERNNRVYVYSNDGNYWSTEEDIMPKTLDNVYLDQKDEVVADMSKFLSSKEWYTEKSISYKRGYMFYGPPGTGKTSLTIALAKHFKRSVYVLNPSRVSDSELKTLFQDVRKNSFLVIEDIDSVFNKYRSKKENEIRFSFSTLLNLLDGVFSKEGLVTIFTTNHIENLDPALIRAGRIDFEVEISYPSILQINKYVSNFYRDNVIFNNTFSNKKLSMAKVQEICIKHRDDKEEASKEIILNLKE